MWKSKDIFVLVLLRFQIVRMSSVCPEGGPPPEYQAVVAPGHRIGPRGTTQPGNVFIPMDEPPPDYEVATTLPTYEQSEMAKGMWHERVGSYETC